MPQDRDATLKDLLQGRLTRDGVEPPVATRPQVLPFDQLSWENLERLCTRLVASQNDVVDCHRYGVRGDFQAGIDVLAHRRTAEGKVERWCYQCKRWQKMTPAALRQVVDSFSFPADQYVVFVSFEASAELRAVVADLPNVDLWDAEDISRELKNHQGLVEDFFGRHWQDAFCPDVQQTIRQHLGLDRAPALVAEEVQATLEAAPHRALFRRGGLCSGYPLHPLPDRYFVAQDFSSSRDDLREALTTALAEFGVQPICADDFLWSGHILCKISALIQSTPFSIYQLTTGQNRNVYLELGIAIGLGRPFVLVKERGAEMPLLAQGLEYYPMDSYLELRYELGPKVRPFLANIANYRTPTLPPPHSQPAVAIAHGDQEVIDFCIPVAKIIAEHGLVPVVLGDPTGRLAHYLKSENVPHHIIGSTGRTRLDEIVATIQAAHLGVYRIEQTGAPDTFLALGVSIGLGRPILLTHHRKVDPPSDVKGLGALTFGSYADLGQSLPEQLALALRQGHPPQAPIGDPS